MSGLAPLVLTALVGATVLVVVYLALLRHDRSPHLRYWTLAWVLSWIRYAAAYAALSSPSVALDLTLLLASLASAACLFMGAYAFSARALPSVWKWVFAAGAGWVVVSKFASFGFLALTLPVFTLLGVSMLVAARALWLAPLSSPRTATRLVAVTLAAWGLHRLDYPFLRPIEWLAPFGFGLAAAMELMVAVGSALAHAEHVRNRLRVSEERYRMLVDNSPQGIFCTTTDGRFLNANPALVRMLGFQSETEVLAIDIAKELYVEPAARDRARGILADRDELDGFETEWRRKDGTRLRVALYARKVRSEAGEVTMYQGVAVDVTERHRLDQRLRQGERLEALGRLAGGVAHDFNNLLTVIRGAAELTLHVEDTAQREQCIAEVLDATDRAAQLTGQLLAVSRQKPVEPRSVDMAKHVEKATRLLRRMVGEDIEVKTECDGAECNVHIDPAQLDQILLNLAANARDAQPGGGSFSIRIDRLALDETEAEHKSVAPGDYVRLCASDDGPGMDAATRQHAFEPFFTTRGDSGGTGLGLATVYAAVLQAGGTVQLLPNAGAGAKFEILFPRDTREQRAPGPDSSAGVRSSGLTVLVVEDEPTVRHMVARILRASEHQVLVASDAQEALRILDDATVDVLLTDVVMRGKSGGELAAEVRARLPETNIVFMSGYPKSALGKDGSIPEGCRFLAKPFTSEQLLAIVQRRSKPKARVAS